MKVALDISPIRTGHSVRGIGSYTKNLIEEFKKIKVANLTFEFFENSDTPPPADVTHYPYFDFFFHNLPIKKRGSRVVTVHDVIPLVFSQHFPRGVRGNVNLFLQKRALKNVDAIICDSQTSKKDVVEKLNYPKEKIHVIYLAPSPIFKKISNQKQLLRVSKKYNLPKRFVLYVGDVNWSKNIPNLLKAITKINVSLVMVGKALVDDNLSETKKINNLIKTLNLKNKIIKTGFVANGELAAIYNLASATVITPFYEGFGLPVLESMACGTPVVCSSVASLKEIGKNYAEFCDPDDPADISKKLQRVLTTKEKVSTSLIKHASKYSWNKVAKQTVDVYKLLNR